MQSHSNNNEPNIEIHGLNSNDLNCNDPILNPSDINDPDVNDVLKDKLLPYQIDHSQNIAYSLKTYKRALDASDTGTGKTYTAIASAIRLKLKPLIICPKSVINNWKKVLDFFNCEYYGISNYESIQNCKYYPKSLQEGKKLCPFIKRSIKIKTDKKKKKKIKFNFGSKEEKQPKKDYLYQWNIPDDMLLIFDEAHRCKNKRTTNSDVLKAAANCNSKILLLSATVSDKPENFALAGYTLGLYKNMKEATLWIDKASEEFSNPMQGVHNHVFPEYGSRMRIRDLGKLFPDNQILCQCYDMDDREEIQKQYDLIAQAVENLKKKEDASCALAQILYARMRIEMLKVPTFIELAREYLDQGLAIAIFVNFTETLNTIAKELKTDCLVYGEQTIEMRNKNIDDFNNDQSQIIICNIRSGGVGISLHDTNGKYPRISLISPGYSAVDILQALGRICRANCKTPVQQKILFANGTIENQMCDNIKDKIKNIGKLNDGDMLSYNIQGLTDDKINELSGNDISEFDKTFQRINVLNMKRFRLEIELKDTMEEIKSLELALNNFIE